MASEEDDDPIIQEIDVYLANSLADKLYLFQYPVRPSSMTYDDVTHLSAKIKPKQQKVELEMAINTLSPNYCRSKGEQIALNVDGTTSEDSNTYSVKMMDKQTFTSIQSTTNTSRYAAAVFRKGELHITPLQGILQMRPSFSYLDKADGKHREREAANEGGDSSQDERSPGSTCTTTASTHCQYQFNTYLRQYLYCQAMGGSENTELVKTPKEYLAMLMPPITEEKMPVGPSNMLSMAQLRTLPLGDQVKTLLKNVKVIPFANLMGLLTPGTDSTAVLRCIQQVALLVQGNWVVKSDVLYPKNSCSPHSGVPAEVLCRGRDFVMWRFTQERSVMRKEVTAIIKLLPEDVKDFLEHMAVPRINRGWEFLLPSDSDFIKKHPDVAQRQHMLWIGIQSKLEKVFNFSKEDLVSKKDPQTAMHVSGEQRLKAAHERARQNQPSLQKDLSARRQGKGGAGPSSGAAVRVKEEPVSDGEDEPMDTSSSALPNGLVNGYPSAATSAALNPHNGHGRTPMPSPSPELRDFVWNMFRKQHVLTLSEVKRLFNLHLASLPPGDSLFHSISDRLLQDTILMSHCKQILVPPFAFSDLIRMCLKDPFLLSTFQDLVCPAPQHRQVLYEIFMKNYRVRRNVIQTRLTQEMGDQVTKDDVDRLLKECCVSFGGMWYLKGTLQS
uniref:Polymerase (RNA) III (DNA directed) polypeptide E n=1 Tax=Oncorhynchus kisutch TaxID=8019 RepID=A0A8C7LHJ2_ONCKI